LTGTNLLVALVLSKVASGGLDCQAENVAARLEELGNIRFWEMMDMSITVDAVGILHRLLRLTKRKTFSYVSKLANLGNYYAMLPPSRELSIGPDGMANEGCQTGF